jgi:hypothetical protein
MSDCDHRIAQRFVGIAIEDLNIEGLVRADQVKNVHAWAQNGVDA